MKKKLILGLMLAVVLSLSMSSTIAAASNVVVNDKGQDTDVYEWVYDEADGYYEITETMHWNWHYKEYADGTAQYNYHGTFIQEAYGEGFFGDYMESTSQYRESFNSNVGNGEVLTYKEFFVQTSENGVFDSKYQLIFHFANGEVRVDILRVE